jgi:hypothetical protein
VTPGNVFDPPKNKIKSLYEEETVRIDEMLDVLNVSGIPDNFRTKYKKQPAYMKFPFSDSFNNLVLEKIKPLFQQTEYYKDSKITVIRDLYDMFWLDDRKDNCRYFVFSIIINDKHKSFARKLKVHVKITNFSKYVTDTGEWNFQVTSINSSDFQILYIGTEQEFTYLTVPGIEGNEDFHNYYRIKGNLYLMEPFPTSGKDMVITDDMKSKFMKTLDAKGKKEEGFCYNSTNLTARDKYECVDSGGVWDYPPSDDTECPFYMSNQNYPNNFGKLDGNTCELPRNMQVIGHRYYSYDPQYKPLCYNCKTNLIGEGTLGYCCDDQKNNKMVYPELITPDYAFIGDQQLREKYSKNVR